MLAMFLVIYIASKWSECMERKEESVQSYGFLCILAVWALTVKLSTAGSLLLVILPAIQLIRKRNRGYIIKDLVCGLVTAIPWLIRNVLISGYLIYPYAAIDWFPVDWKMPEEVLEMDKMEIVVFGREVKNVAAYHDPVTAWLPTWFGNQMMKYKLLIIVGFAATAFLIAALIIMICKAIRKRKLTEGNCSAQLLMLLISILLGEVFWLFSAPLVRYGMVYLMMPVAAAYYLGFIEKEELDAEVKKNTDALENLRQGMFAPKNRGKILEKTEEGIDISMNLLKKGYLSDDEIEKYPGITHKIGIHPVMECSQNIPCNPCQDACPKHCIKIGENITSLPAVDETKECIGCGMCVASCSGQAIFLIDENLDEDFASVTLPYEFLPLPEKGTKGHGLGRNGEEICEAEVIGVKTAKAFDHTNLLTIKVPKEYVMKARFFKA